MKINQALFIQQPLIITFEALGAKVWEKCLKSNNAGGIKMQTPQTIISSGARKAEGRPSEANFKIIFAEKFCGFDGLGQINESAFQQHPNKAVVLKRRLQLRRLLGNLMVQVNQVRVWLGQVRLGQVRSTESAFQYHLDKTVNFLTLSQVMIVSGSPLHGGFKVAAAEKRMQNCHHKSQNYRKACINLWFVTRSSAPLQASKQ